MQHYNIQKEETLLAFLQRIYAGMSHTKIKSLLSEHRVLVNNKIVSQYNYPLHLKDKVEIKPQKERTAFKSPYLKLIYEDRWLVVIEKSIGILSMGTPHHSFCVKTVLDNYFDKKKLRVRAHVVHRLDRETSGVMVYAKSIEVQNIFRENWHRQVTDRRYYAVVEGKLQQPNGCIKSWLKDNKSFFTYSSPVDNGGKVAITHYRTLATNDKFSLVELKLETGRKNQIRVHMQELGHPVVGDVKYGSTLNPIGRLCLHAFRLNFEHPVTHEVLNFETQYPSDFARLIQHPDSRA